MISKYDERLQQSKSDHQQEVQELMAKMTAQKEQTEAKYDQKRKQFKENENILQKKISEFQKENAVMTEKISSSSGLSQDLK